MQDIDNAISKGHIVNQITNDDMKKIDEIYEFRKTDKTEKGFIFGQKGKSSKIVTGRKAGEIGHNEWAEAHKDLKEQGDIMASDVHLHPLGYNEEGDILYYGLSKPSDTDKSPRNMSRNTQPSMVLGWKENIIPVPTGQIGGTPTKTHTPEVGFYDIGGSIITVDYSNFKRAKEKVNK